MGSSLRNLATFRQLARARPCRPEGNGVRFHPLGLTIPGKDGTLKRSDSRYSSIWGGAPGTSP
jgi:hypothetical protein